MPRAPRCQRDRPDACRGRSTTRSPHTVVFPTVPWPIAIPNGHCAIAPDQRNAECKPAELPETHTRRAPHALPNDHSGRSEVAWNRPPHYPNSEALEPAMSGSRRSRKQAWQECYARKLILANASQRTKTWFGCNAPPPPPPPPTNATQNHPRYAVTNQQTRKSGLKHLPKEPTTIHHHHPPPHSPARHLWLLRRATPVTLA